MKKRFALLLTFILAFAVALGVLAGCDKKKGDVTVEISKTTLELVTGKWANLIATASDGSEIVWTTSNEAVATVNEAGRVTGVSAGTATVTATVKDGEANATCEVTVKDPVTFTFKDASGATITTATVDRNGDPVQLSAVASDGSEVTGWSSSDERFATVTREGLVTGLKEGDITLTVRTATGSGEIALTVTDSFDGEHYEITTEQTEGQWYYWVRTDKGQTWDVSGELRGDKLTFAYDGGNWDADSIYLAIKNPSVANGWRRLSMKIESDIETVITVNGTRVNLIEGLNDVSVCYNQTDLASATITFSNSEAGTSPDAMKVVITGIVWTAFEPVTLETPTFAIEGDTVTITDPNEEGVKQYEVALFAEGSTTAVHNQPFLTKSGDLDTTAVEQNGEYIVRIRAIGNPGFESSAWSTGDDIKYTVNNTDIKYTLSTDGTHGSGASVALTSGRWEYWAVTEEASSCESAVYENGTITVKFNRGWSWYGMQLFRHYAQYEEGASLKVSMTITVTGASGNITVCGVPVTLEDGVAKTVELAINQPGGDGSTTLTVSFGEAGSGQLPSEDSLPGYVAIEATVSDISVEEFVPETLATPSATYTAAADENPAKIEVTDNDNEEEKVASYQVGFFNKDTGKLAGTALIKEDGTFSDRSIEDGTYVLKVRAVASSALYANSEWTEAINSDADYVVANGGTTVDITSGGESDSVANVDTWYIWTDVAKFTTKSVTTLTGSNEQTIDIAYSGNTNNWYGVQLFYKNSELTAGKVYTLTLNITSSVACEIQLNGNVITLAVGDNPVTINYAERANNASLSVQFGKESGAVKVEVGTFSISNVKWEEYELEKLQTPSIAIDELNYTITDTANTVEGSVAGYKIAIYSVDGKLATSATVTAKTGKLDVSLLETGKYTVKVTAVGTLLYAESDESSAVELDVVNEGGIKYDLPFGQAADDEWGNKGLDVDGRYYLWNDQNWAGATVTMSESSYDNGTITLKYNCTAGGSNFAVQVFRKANDLTAGNEYTLSFKINVENATAITINGTNKSLVAGDNEISVTFTAPTCTQAGGDCIFSMQITAKSGESTASNTIVISNIAYTPVEA